MRRIRSITFVHAAESVRRPDPDGRPRTKLGTFFSIRQKNVWIVNKL